MLRLYKQSTIVYNMLLLHISACRKKEDLPKEAIDYIAYLEKACGCKIKYVSVGAERDAYVEMY